MKYSNTGGQSLTERTQIGMLALKQMGEQINMEDLQMIKQIPLKAVPS